MLGEDVVPDPTGPGAANPSGRREQQEESRRADVVVERRPQRQHALDVGDVRRGAIRFFGGLRIASARRQRGGASGERYEASERVRGA
jgi:hypothetical protein